MTFKEFFPALCRLQMLDVKYVSKKKEACAGPQSPLLIHLEKSQMGTWSLQVES